MRERWRSGSAGRSGRRPRPPAPAGLTCSFCGKRRDQVKDMVAGQTRRVAICDECVELCTEIFAEHAQRDQPAP